MKSFGIILRVSKGLCKVLLEIWVYEGLAAQWIVYRGERVKDTAIAVVERQERLITCCSKSKRKRPMTIE